MSLIFLGIAIMLAGLALLMTMVVGVVLPSLLLSLTSYAILFAGMLCGMAGALRHLRRNGS